MGDAKKGKKTLFGNKTPRLRLTFRSSFDNNDANKTNTFSLLPASEAKPSRESTTSGIGAAFKSGSKMMRLRTKKRVNSKELGIGSKPIATKCACTHFVGDPNVLNLLRPNLPLSSSVMATVSKKSKTGSTKEKKTPSLVKLDCGVLSFKPLPSAKGSATLVHGHRDSFFIANMCAVVYEQSDKVVQIQARLDTPKSEKDENGHRGNQQMYIYVIGFDTTAQARMFVQNLVIEANNFATVIDLGLGWMEEHKNKEKMGNHLECLLRKRVDLYNISKPEGSEVLTFAMQALAGFLKENGDEEEASYWEEYLKPEEATVSDGKNKGLISVQEDYLSSLKKNNFEVLEQKLGLLFKSEEEKADVEDESFDGSAKRALQSSFYANLFTSGRFDDVC